MKIKNIIGTILLSGTIVASTPILVKISDFIQHSDNNVREFVRKQNPQKYQEIITSQNAYNPQYWNKIAEEIRDSLRSAQYKQIENNFKAEQLIKKTKIIK